MTSNLKIKILVIVVVILVCIYGIIGIPTSTQQLVDNWHKNIHLGLDLKGGSQLVLQVQIQDAFKAEGEDIWLIGGPGSHLGQSLWLRELQDREDGPPPPVNLDAERRNGETVRQLIAEGAVTAVHDISDGGLLVALAEMALAGGIGANLETSLSSAPVAFGEDQGRYLVTAPVAPPGGRWIGRTGGDTIGGARLADLRNAHEGFFPQLMER